MAFPPANKMAAIIRAAQKARDQGPELEEPGEVEPRGSNRKREAAEEKREKS